MKYYLLLVSLLLIHPLILAASDEGGRDAKVDVSTVIAARGDRSTPRVGFIKYEGARTPALVHLPVRPHSMQN